MATQSKYDKEKKKDKKTLGKEETNGRLSTTSSKSSVKDDASANKKASSSTSSKTTASSTSSTSANRGNANRSNYTPKYNTYSSKTNTYSYVPKTSTSRKTTSSQKTTSDPWSEWLEFVRSKRNEAEASKTSSTSSATSSVTGKRGEVNRSRTPKYNTYNSQTSTWSYDPYASKTEDQREARTWLAQAGITDLSNMTDIEATRQKVYDAATPTNSDDFKSSPEYVKFLAGKNAYNAEMYRQNLIAGLDELGLSEEERNRVLGEANTKADTASEIYALARARMGDQSAVEQLTGDARTDAERLAKMYGYDLVAGDDTERWSRLYGYDTATELLSQQLPSEMQQAGTAPVDIPEDYDSNSFNEDRYVYKFGEKIGGGAVTEEERQEAKRRLELVLGIDDADTVTDWSAVSFDPDYVKDLNVLNGSSETYQDVLTKTTQYDADKIADDILVLRDYYENNGSRSNDEVQRAGNRVKAATGVDVLNAEDFESAFDQAVQNNDALRDAVAQAVYNETGKMPDGAEFDLDNYLTYIQAYMQQQNHVDHAEAEQLQFDDTIQQKYGQYEAAADYATLSQPVSLSIAPATEGEAAVYSTMLRQLSAQGITTEAEAIHEAIVAIDNPELFDQLVDGMTGMPTAAQQKYTADTITSEQRKMFNYLWNSGRPDEAMEYLDDIDWSVRKAIAAKTEEVSQELSGGVGGGIGSSLASVLMSPARAVVAPVNAVRTALGQEIDEYDQGFNVGRASDTIRGNVGQNLDELLNGANILGWNIGSGVYQGAMSIADSWMTAPLGANLGAATMGLEAADSAMREGMEKGRTQTEALRDAAVTAGVEWATEKLPLENLFGDVGKPGKYIISNMFSEMGEEITSEVAEMIYDTLAYGDESDLGELYNDLVTQGYDKKGVTIEMLKEIAGRLRDAGFGGAAGGLIGAAPRGIATAVSDRSSGRNLQANDAARSMLDLAGKVLPGGEAKSLASEQLQEIDSRGEASNAKVGRVYRELLNNIDEQTRQVVDDTMLRNVRKQLKSMGEGSTELAEAVTRVVAGDGSAQAEDYAMVGANDAARKLATSLTERVSEARGLAETADDLAEKASRKIEGLKKTTPAAEKATDTAVNESVNEDVDEWSELYADEDISDDIDEDSEVEVPEAEVSEDAEADEDSEVELPEAEVSTTKDGEEVSIIGAESVGTDGELMYKVKTADGEQKTVKATEVNIGTNDDASARLAEYARQYGANAESMFNARLESQDVDAYAEAFQRAVEYGSDGRNLDTVSRYSSLSELNPNQIRIAYEIGRAERIARADLTQQGKTERLTASGSVPVGNVDISKIKSVNSLNKHQKNSIVAMRSIAELLGINVEFFESTADAQGKYQGKQGGWNPETLTLSMDIHAGSNYAGDLNYALMHTAGHELTHMIFEFANSDVRNGYQEYIMDQLSQKMSAEELDARVEKLLEMPEINSRDAAIEEIVAEASVEALSKMTEADIQDLVMQNRPLYKRIAYSIAQWARGMKKKIANAFKGTEAKNEYAKLLNDQLDELALKWIDALRDATIYKHIRTGVEMVTQEDVDAKYGIESDSSDADERKFSFFDDDYEDIDWDDDAFDDLDEEDWDDSHRSWRGKLRKIFERIRDKFRRHSDDDIDWDDYDPYDEEFDEDLSIIFGHRGPERVPEYDDNLSIDFYDIPAKSKALQKVKQETETRTLHEADSNFGITDKEVDDYFYKFYDGLMEDTKERIERGDTPRTKVLYAFDDSDLSFESRRAIRLRELVMEKVMEELRTEGFLEAEAQQEAEARPEVQTQQEVQAEALQEVETQQEVQQEIQPEIQVQEETQAEVQEETETQPAVQQEEGEWWEDSVEEKPAKAQDGKAKEASETRPLKSAHIDQRSMESIRSEDKTLFCSEVEEAQVAYAEAAGILLNDLEQSAPGQKFYIWDEMGDLTVTGQKRFTSELLADIKDTTGWTWDKIKSTLQQFSDMGKAEKGFRVPKNTVATREMELFLDEMLSKGYKTIDGYKITPWDEYVEAKRSYQGSVSEDASPSAYENAISFEDYVFPNPDVETSSDDGGNPFGYDSLTAKPDMSTVKLTPVAIKDRDAAVDMGTANVNKYADRKDPHGTPMMYIPDLGKYVSVGRKAMAHGLDGKRIAMQAPVIAQIGDILENSIVVNEAVPKKVGVQRSWIMLGVAEDWNGDTVYVRSVINQSTGHVEEVAAFYAALGKKNRVSRNVSAERVGEDSLKPSSNSTISVAEMLENVNGTFDDIISENVAEHLGIERSTSEFSERLMYQLRDPDQVSDRELLANAMDSAATNEAELDFVRRYRKKINELERMQARYEEVRQEIQDAQRNGARKSDIAVLENKAKNLGDHLDRVDGQLLKFEAGKPLQAVVQRQREQLKQKLKLKQDAALERQKTRLNQQKQDALQRLSDKKNAALATQREQLKQENKNALKKLRDEKNALLARQHKELKQEKAEKVREVRAEKDESFAKQKYRKAVEKEFSTLRDWVASPTAKAHVPEFLRAPLGDVLSSLDFSSKRSLGGGSETQRDVKFKNALDKMNTALTELRTQRATALDNLTDGQGGLDNSAARFALTIDLPDGYNESFTTLVQGIKDHLDATQSSNTAPINRMTSTQLKELTKSLRILATSVRQMNRLLANAKYDSAVTAARDTMDELGKMSPKKDSIKATAWVGKFLDWTNTVPYYAFKRFGSGGKAIFDGLMDGWDKLAFNSDQVVKFAEDTYTTREVRKWSKKMNTVKLDSGDTVRMTTAQMMSLYCLSKRTQAIGHLLGGGIRIADIESGAKVVRQAENHTLTQHDLQNIASTLTERQRTVADKLQEFMSTQCAEWGNEVSMKRFGYKMLTEKNYFPIESDPNNLSAVSEKSEGESLFRLLNMSSMKELKKGANNALVVHDIFNVFSSHSADMAKYNALGLQILDAMKWLNYVEKANTPDGSHTTRSVQKSLERAYGKDARQYILNLLKDLNGTKEGGRNDGIINKLISNAKVSDVASNLRVYLLQITSMPRAAYAISPKYLSIGLAKAAANPLKAMRTATDKVGIAKWKDMGFYDTNISGNIREMIKHDQSLVNTVREGLMAPAGWADNMTMGTIYYAVEAECAKRHPNVQKGSAVWDKLVNNRMREIVYQTQVVDSTMTRSDIMRGKGIATLTTAFMSEPTLSLNMLADGVYEARMAKRSGASAGAPIAKIARGAATFVVTAVVTAAFEAAFDAARDDDEFETLDEKYMAALIGDFTEDDTSWQKFAKVLFSDLGDNLNFISNIPGVSKLFDSLQGYDDTTMYTEFFNYMIKSYDAYQDTLDNKGTDYNWIYKALKGLSAAVGLPFSNATRDAVSIWNTFLADRLNKPRIQTYANTETQAAEAIVAAQKAGDTERVARIRQRASVYGMSEDKINSKVAKLAEEELASGKIDRSTATDLMTGEGNQRASETKSALNSADYQLATGGLKLSKMSDDYIAGTITEAQARQYLAKYKGLRGEEIDTEISKWNYERDTGMTYSQMKTDYLDGVLTDSEVLRYRTKYGGVEQESAQSTLDHWKYEADTGLAWDDLEDDYGDGVITEAQARQYLAKYDGKTEAEVDDKINAMDYHIATGRTGTCKYWRIAYAFDNGQDYTTTIKETFDKIMHGGEEEKTWEQARRAVVSSLASYYKADYEAVKGTDEGDAMVERILPLFEAIGYDREYQRGYIAENW